MGGREIEDRKGGQERKEDDKEKNREERRVKRSYGGEEVKDHSGWQIQRDILTISDRNNKGQKHYV